MDGVDGVAYTIDADDTIVWVDDRFRAFGSAYGVPALEGTSLWSHISGRETTYLWRTLVDRAREAQSRPAFRTRCVGRELTLDTEIRLRPAADGSVAFEAAFLAAWEHASIPLFDDSLPRDPQELLVVCSWCNRAKLRGDWVELETAVRELDLLRRRLLPQITHGICEDDLARLGVVPRLSTRCTQRCGNVD